MQNSVTPHGWRDVQTVALKGSAYNILTSWENITKTEYEWPQHRNETTAGLENQQQRKRVHADSTKEVSQRMAREMYTL